MPTAIMVGGEPARTFPMEEATCLKRRAVRFFHKQVLVSPLANVNNPTSPKPIISLLVFFTSLQIPFGVSLEMKICSCSNHLITFSLKDHQNREKPLLPHTQVGRSNLPRGPGPWDIAHLQQLNREPHEMGVITTATFQVTGGQPLVSALSWTLGDRSIIYTFQAQAGSEMYFRESEHHMQPGDGKDFQNT